MARLDKWLWGARFYKTRALANAAISSGKVKINNLRIKPSKTVSIGDTVSINKGQGLEITVMVVAIEEQRVAYPIAQLRYEETQDSLDKKAAREAAVAAGLLDTPHPKEKPDKKQRRQLLALRKS